MTHSEACWLLPVVVFIYLYVILVFEAPSKLKSDRSCGQFAVISSTAAVGCFQETFRTLLRAQNYTDLSAETWEELIPSDWRSPQEKSHFRKKSGSSSNSDRGGCSWSELWVLVVEAVILLWFEASIWWTDVFFTDSEYKTSVLIWTLDLILQFEFS